MALPGFAWLAVMWLTLGQLAQWYYVHVPDVVRHSHVFTRGTGGSDVGEARVLALIDGIARQQVPAVFWSQAALLLTVSAIMLWLLFSSTYASNHDCPPHHR